MTNKEYTIKNAECCVRNAETKVREAMSELEHGHAKLKADFEREYLKLKLALERARNDLAREKAFLENARDEAKRGFEA